ncbi:MAG TPA: PQQ-dependent catabolism-associated beta-propeller protein [Rudaea sp.]|jgi:PQQ-dependent catabolism-associated beta-propeller protein
MQSAEKLLPIALLLCAMAPAGAETAYVSDEQANVVHVLSAPDWSVHDIPVGKRPRGMVRSHDGKFLYVALGNDDRIDVIDLAARKVVKSIPSGPDPERFAVSPDGKWLYVANENDSLVSFVDIAAKKVVRTVEVGAEPEGMAASPDGRWVICTSESASLVHFIDAGTGKLVDSVLVGTRPRDAQFNADGTRLWVSSETRGTVAIFDVATRKVLHTIDFDSDPNAPDTVQAVGIAFAPDQKHVYVALGRGNAVAEVNADTFAVEGYDPVGSRNWGVALSPDGSHLFAANGLSGNVTVIDLRDHSGRTVATGGKPWGVVVTP